MKRATDFRKMARRSLRGNWLIAVITGFLASLLGGTIAGGGSSIGTGSSTGTMEKLFTDSQIAEFIIQQLLQLLVGILLVFAGVLLIWLLLIIIVSGPAKLGYALFNLNLADQKEARISDLFSQFHRVGTGFCMNFFMVLFVILWSLLLVIPGLIKGLSYAMTPYILCENQGMGALEAITQSRKVMHGNKWRLFCLGFSFIGWEILCVLPVIMSTTILSARAVLSGDISVMLGVIPCAILTYIGKLFLRSYQETAYAAFYREISKSTMLEEEEIREDSIYENNIRENL